MPSRRVLFDRQGTGHLLADPDRVGADQSPGRQAGTIADPLRLRALVPARALASGDSGAQALRTRACRPAAGRAAALAGDQRSGWARLAAARMLRASRADQSGALCALGAPGRGGRAARRAVMHRHAARHPLERARRVGPGLLHRARRRRVGPASRRAPARAGEVSHRLELARAG
jgi:hypothetical protein